MRYAPGKVPTKPLPAAPSRPGVKPTITGAPATPITPKPMGALPAAPPRPIRDIGTGAPPFNPNNPRAVGFPGVPPIRDVGTGTFPFDPNNPRATPITPKPMGGIGSGKNPNLGASFGTGFNQPSTQAKFNQMQNILAGKPMKKGGKVSSASKRADGCAIKGKTKGKMV